MTHSACDLCQPCPFAASCFGRSVVLARAGFWGRNVLDGGFLTFSACPIGYCSTIDAAWNDTCMYVCSTLLMLSCADDAGPGWLLPLMLVFTYTGDTAGKLTVKLNDAA